MSVTILPILAPFILRLGGKVERFRWELALDRFVQGKVLHPIQEFFVRTLRRRAAPQGVCSSCRR